MPALEQSAGVLLELKDLDTSKRTTVIRHAVYGSIDRAKDISYKGMFTKSWNEGGLPDFRFNHDKNKRPGKVTRVFEDTEGAYTEAKFANTTIGNDVLEMAAEDMLSGASFGYVAEKKDYSVIKGQRIRNLREVKHFETSLLDVLPCHPEAGIITLNKAFEQLEIKMLSQPEQDALKTILTNDMATLQSLVTLAGALDTNSDLYGSIMYMVSRRADTTSSVMDQLRWNQVQVSNMKSYVEKIDNFCTKAKASDETIIMLQNQSSEYKNIISQYDTAITPVATEPNASDDEVKGILTNFITTLNIQTWQKKQLASS